VIPKERDLAGGMLHDEQHVQPLEQQGVDAEEVGGKNGSSELRTDISRLSHRHPRLGRHQPPGAVAELSPLSPQLAYLCKSCSETGTVRGQRGDGALFAVLALSNWLSPRHYG